MERRGIKCRSAYEKLQMQQRIAHGEYDGIKFVEHQALLRRRLQRHTQTRPNLPLLEFKTLPVRVQSLYINWFQPFLAKSADIASRGLMFDLDTYHEIMKHKEELLEKMQHQIRSEGFLRGISVDRRAFERVKVEHPRAALTRKSWFYRFCKNRCQCKWPRRGEALSQTTPVIDRIVQEATCSHATVPYTTAVKYHEFLNLFSTPWSTYVDWDYKVRPSVKFPGANSTRVMQFGCHPLRLPKFGRPLIHASPGNLIYEFDFKAQEIGLAASYYGDSDLLEIYNNHSFDLYATIGQKMGEFPYDLSTVKEHKQKREEIKTAILAISYGGGRNALKENLGCTDERTGNLQPILEKPFYQLREGRKAYFEECARHDFRYQLHRLPTEISGVSHHR